VKQIVDTWKQKAGELKILIYALFLAYRDPRTPWYAKAFTALVVGYAFSPIDLIPDFVPVLGYLDDLILLPIGVIIALRLIPAEIMMECKERAQENNRAKKPVNYFVGVAIVVIWITILLLVALFLCRRAGMM